MFRRDPVLPRLLAIITTLGLAGLILCSPTLHAEDSRDRLGQLSSRSMLDASTPYGRLLKKKLFVTPGEVARYLYLASGGKYDRADWSAAVYRKRGKAGSLPGSYWVTATEASASLITCVPYEGQEEPRVDPRSVVVQRHDAALPASTAQALHELWLAMLERSQPGDEISISPTGVFSATDASGRRLRAATRWLDDKSISGAMMTLGNGLIHYPKLPIEERQKYARVLEEQSRRLLKRVMKLPRD